jgi:mannosyltransferase OCH1-like enzyme
VPKVIHQLVPDDMDTTGTYWYPDTSRAVKSFSNHPGWEYRRYLPEDMECFLTTHFPEELVLTFRSLTSRASRLDLFRYCVLLVHGGIFVNEDVLLESRLDAILDPDVGFMVSTDSRVRPVTYVMLK